jgi:DNA primase
VQRVEVPKKGGVVHHAIVTDVRSLLWVTNQNAVTQHVCTSRVPDLDHPDICVFDLDPSVARRCRRRARGRKSSGATSSRRRSRFEAWPLVFARSATCGTTCGVALDR